MLLEIRNVSTIRRLAEIAEREQRSIEAVLDTLVDLYPQQTELGEDVLTPGTSSLILESIEKYAMNLGTEITSENADEILKTEFANYLLKRMQPNDDASETGANR